MGKEGHQCENDADHGENLADIGGVVGETAEAKDGGDDCDDEEDDGPVEHGIILSLKVWIEHSGVLDEHDMKCSEERK